MTARKLASVRKIDHVVPHKNADRLEVAILGGWPVVVRKGEFKQGDLVVFCEVDCLLPPRPEYDYLEKSCSHTEPDGTEWYRIKTVRLRGQLSQGIVLPLSILNGDGFSEGDVVTERLGIRKYEKPLPPQLAGEALGIFPYFIPKTDEERVQNFDISSLPEGWYRVTEKLDGSSCTIYRNQDHVGVCSRNLELKPNANNTFWHAAHESGALAALASLDSSRGNIAIQGEVVGPGIQGNPYKLKCHRFYAFNVYLIDEARYMTKKEFDRFCFTYAILTVPYLGDTILPESMSGILQMAEGKSRINSDVEREGIVVVKDGEDERISFKAISNKFLLNGGE